MVSKTLPWGLVLGLCQAMIPDILDPFGILNTALQQMFLPSWLRPTPPTPTERLEQGAEVLLPESVSGVVNSGIEALVGEESPDVAADETFVPRSALVSEAPQDPRPSFDLPAAVPSREAPHYLMHPDDARLRRSQEDVSAFAYRPIPSTNGSSPSIMDVLARASRAARSIPQWDQETAAFFVVHQQSPVLGAEGRVTSRHSSESSSPEKSREDASSRKPASRNKEETHEHGSKEEGLHERSEKNKESGDRSSSEHNESRKMSGQESRVLKSQEMDRLQDAFVAAFRDAFNAP